MGAVMMVLAGALVLGPVGWVPAAARQSPAGPGRQKPLEANDRGAGR